MKLVATDSSIDTDAAVATVPARCLGQKGNREPRQFWWLEENPKIYLVLLLYFLDTPSPKPLACRTSGCLTTIRSFPERYWGE
jgi:hypothetical protein